MNLVYIHYIPFLVEFQQGDVGLWFGFDQIVSITGLIATGFFTHISRSRIGLAHDIRAHPAGRGSLTQRRGWSCEQQPQHNKQ